MNELEKLLGLVEVSPAEKVLEEPSARNLRDVPKNCQTYEMLITVCKADGLALEYASKKLTTPELCQIAVKQNGLALKFIPDKIIKKRKRYLV